jgi:hypothetical protein
LTAIPGTARLAKGKFLAQNHDFVPAARRTCSRRSAIRRRSEWGCSIDGRVGDCIRRPRENRNDRGGSETERNNVLHRHLLG